MDTATPKFCEACGKPLAPGSRFCEECGHDVAVDPAPPAMAAPAPVTQPPPLAGISGPASTAAAPPAPPVQAVAPGARVAGGRPVKTILIAVVLLLVIGLGALVAVVGVRLWSRASGKPHAVAAQGMPPAPGQAQATPGVTGPGTAPEVKPADPPPTAQQWVDRGYAAEQAGQVQEALAAYTQALALSGDRKLADHIQQLKQNSSSVAGPAPEPEPEPEPEPVPAKVRVTPQLAQAAVILHATTNKYAVLNGATQPNTLVVAEPMVLTSIMTYHWNNAKGKTPGIISLEHEDGTQYGGWQATGSDGQGGVPNAAWNVAPGVLLKPGKYTLLDSHPASWSQNAATGGKGMCEIKGVPWRQVRAGR